MPQPSRNRDVEEAVIGPMTALFSPPKRLQGNSRAIEAALDVYRRALAPFPRVLLEEAWQQAASKAATWAWPTPAEILREAEQLARQAQQSRPAEGWVAEATTLTDTYTRRFLQTSQVAARGREGGYEDRLKAYVTEAAWVQAQLLAGRKDGLGYSSVLFAHVSGEELADAREEFFQRAEAQAARGFIRVPVPPCLIEHWKAQTEKGRGRG